MVCLTKTQSSPLLPTPGNLSNFKLGDNATSGDNKHVIREQSDSSSQLKGNTAKKLMRSEPLDITQSEMFEKGQIQNNADSESIDNSSNIAGVSKKEHSNNGGESKKTPISPKSATLKQENAQSGNSNHVQVGNENQKLQTIVQEDSITINPVAGTNTSASMNNTTKLKLTIAIFLSCTSSVIAGVCIYPVILAISNATLIPIIFIVGSTVSILVAVASTIYLSSFIVEILSDKKKIDLSKKEFGEPSQQQEYTQLQEPTQEFEYSTGSDKVDGRMELKSKSNIPTPPPLPPTTGTASPQVTQNQSASVPPPPPPPPMQQGAGAPPPPPPPPPGMNLNNGDGGRTSLLDSIRKAGGKPKKNGQNSSDSTDSFPNKDKPSDYLEELGDKLKANGSEQREGINEKIERERKEKIEKMIEDSKNSNSLTAILVRRNIATHGSDDSDRESEYSDHDNERADDEEWDAVFAYQERVNPTEAGAVSAFGPSNGTNPHEKPSVPPKPKDLTSKLKPALTQAPPATAVNDTDPVSSETQNPSTFSVKSRREMFGG